ncbi:hypothetical protein SAMN05428988_1304 [Chitinophaga sp. YR573]|uniref:hypothetical protein n=1 Tax=Chitinophaga sp. YR573 TaxID=1881040 RepID=UPI0008C3F528|nr:hypothetical protein [Chitinophaga sp. YR573]SEW01845.1 hypothetical protein SAMN05428988_1304 [Chitinophaga sp. YR573]
MPVIKRHQTLIDFAVQYTGSVEGIMQVASLNNISPTDDALAGVNLLYGAVIDVKNSFATLKNEVATDGRLQEAVSLEGIGYWNIGLNFKVS